METRATMPPPRSATAATRGREIPPVSVSFCGALAEALAIGLMEALIEALDEDVVPPPPPPPDTLTLAVISGCIEQW
jgi:hypothetical protein